MLSGPHRWDLGDLENRAESVRGLIESIETIVYRLLYGLLLGVREGKPSVEE